MTDRSDIGGDAVLATLVALAHHLGHGTTIGVTLIVEGGTYSGNLVSGADWFQAVATMIRDHPIGTLGTELARLFDQVGADYLSEESKDKPLGFAHLLDAWSVNAFGERVRGLPMRIRLDAISGWAVGTWGTRQEANQERGPATH